MEAVKRAILCMMALLLCAGLTGCAREQEAGIRINVVLETTEPISGISYEYSVAGNVCGSGRVVRADGSPMETGEVIDFTFLPSDFPGNTIPEVFTFTVFPENADGQRIPTENSSLNLGRETNGLQYTLTGDSSGCTFLPKPQQEDLP